MQEFVSAGCDDANCTYVRSQDMSIIGNNSRQSCSDKQLHSMQCLWPTPGRLGMSIEASRSSSSSCRKQLGMLADWGLQPRFKVSRKQNER